MRENRAAGFFLVIVGTLYLAMQILDEMNIVLFDFWDLWPLFIIGLGFILTYTYYRNRRAPGVLIPGGILLVIGTLHLFESVTNWHFSEYTWPLYTFAVAFGFLHYWLATREQWSMIVGMILLAIFAFQALIVISIVFNGLISTEILFSVLLIIIGIIFLFGGRRHTE